MAVKRLQKQLDNLKFLASCDKRMRKPVLEHATEDTLTALCECAHNILRGVPKLNPSQQLSLQRHKSLCRFLNRKDVSLTEKRRKLIQTGGSILPALLGPIITALPWLLQQKK